jgi:hypothetical protein
MQKLIAELMRLYLLENQQYEGRPLAPALLDQQLRGETAIALPLVSSTGLTRTLVLHFDGASAGKGEQQWEALCAMANALQNALDLPAPAVSISGADGYALWLSLATPVPVSQACRFLALLLAAHGPDAAQCPPGISVSNETEVLPPCLNRETGKWAAFIHPGMGSSFANEPGLEMAPPVAAQAAFLESLSSITAAQFARAVQALEQSHGAVLPLAVAAPVSTPPGLLLKDATLDDIVKFLHEKNIEPTFRHLITGSRSD